MGGPAFASQRSSRRPLRRPDGPRRPRM